MILTPGCGMGTKIMDWRRCTGVSGESLVLPMKMQILQRGSMAPLVNHLRPLSTYSSPSRRMVLQMLVASELATAGSVMAKAERIFPSNRGVNHLAFCSSLPYLISTSMLPVSGALELKISGEKGMCPMISASRAYSSLEKPCPYFTSGSISTGTHGFQRPSAFAFSFSVSMIGGTVHLSADIMCLRTSGSIGYTSLSIKF
mmetsp:Transcript_75997/g.203911  ORF Transcript_75997/g.203911 Transcript_75997/m.203911 type:complete len:201 (-) Transcript_75997:162-764(-)